MKKVAAFLALVLVLGAGLLLFRHADAPTSTGTSTPAATTTGETTTGGTTLAIPEEGEVTLTLGEPAVFKGIRITPTKVLEDSRCPAGVYCIQAGTVKVFLAVSSPVGTTTKTATLGDSLTVGNQKITFVKVDPLKTAKATIKPADYRFTISVEKRSTTGELTGCYIGGCSGEVCSDDPNAVSSCLYKPEFACYKTARCERQPTGQCGWTATTDLQSCLDNARS